MTERLKRFYQKHPTIRKDIYNQSAAINLLIARGYDVVAADGSQIQHTRLRVTGPQYRSQLAAEDPAQLADLITAQRARADAVAE